MPPKPKKKLKNYKNELQTAVELLSRLLIHCDCLLHRQSSLRRETEAFISNWKKES